jgi:hypothetical protein
MKNVFTQSNILVANQQAVVAFLMVLANVGLVTQDDFVAFSACSGAAISASMNQFSF